MKKFFLIISENVDISFVEKLSFENLKSLIDNIFIDAKLNFYDETRLTQINRRIRVKLNSFIVSLTQ